MKTVLIIAYAFPPIGGVGAIRIVKFAKYLANFGWRPVILTVNSSDEFVLDETLRGELPDDLPIYRSRIWEPLNVAQLKKSSSKLSSPAAATSSSSSSSSAKEETATKGNIASNIKSILRHIYFALRIPDDKVGWWPFAVRKGMEIVKKENVDLIVATTPPYTALLIGRSLKRKTGIPFVVDYRDEWSTIEYRDYPSNPITHFINRYLEKSVLRHADALIGLNEPMVENLEKGNLFPSTLRKMVLPNGFDNADYESRPSLKKNQRFTITYTGSFYGRRRSPNYFLAALAQLLEHSPELRELITIRFVGSIYPEHRRFIRENGVEDLVHVTGVVSHAQAVTEQQTADLLLLIVGKGPGSHIVLTGKIFEYLGSRRPILALVPKEGSAAQIIRSTRTGHVVDPEDVDAIEETIRKALLDWQRDVDNFNPDQAVVNTFERQAQTAELASFLNQVAS